MRSEFEKQLSKFFRLADQNPIMSWDISSADANRIADRGFEPVTLTLPMDRPVALTFAQSFMLASLRYPDARLLVRMFEEKAAYQLLLIGEKKGAA